MKNERAHLKKESGRRLRLTLRESTRREAKDLLSKETNLESKEGFVKIYEFGGAVKRKAGWAN